MEDNDVGSIVMPQGQVRNFRVSLVFECDVTDVERPGERPLHATREDEATVRLLVFRGGGP